MPLLRVTYLELTRAPADIPPPTGAERIAAEQVPLDAYLALYRQVGAPLRWDLRLNMPRAQLRLHTDNWDHPAAVPVYQRAGLRIYLERVAPSANL